MTPSRSQHHQLLAFAIVLFAHHDSSVPLACAFSSTPSLAARTFTARTNARGKNFGLHATSSSGSSLSSSETPAPDSKLRTRKKNELTKSSLIPLRSSISSDESPSFDESMWFNKEATAKSPPRGPIGMVDGVDMSGIMSVLSAALLVTGSTVGAGMMILPEAAAGPGMGVSTMLFLGIFCINLLSGYLIAEVAIKQHENSSCEIPSSFKEFADVNLQSEMAGNVIASISLLCNFCVLSFDLVRAGEVSNANFLVDPTSATLAFAALLSVVGFTQSMENLSRVSSMAVAALFITFGSLLVPGLIHVQDPVGTLFAPGTAEGSDGMMHAIQSAAPIFVTTSVYQNIVPSVTKMLDYDRTKTAAAIFLGAGIPVCMYVAWCFAVLGGGVDSSLAGGGPILTAFSAACIVASSISCIMSLAEELENYFSNKPEESRPALPAVTDNGDDLPQKETFSLPSVLLSVLPPLTAGVLLSGGHDFSVALHCAGSYGMPLLYGVIPVALAWIQRTKETPTEASNDFVPGGFASLGLLGAASTGFLAQGFGADLESIMAATGIP
eukprot:scaffold242606_cov61-Attheya_sp.AAC.2